VSDGGFATDASPGASADGQLRRRKAIVPLAVGLVVFAFVTFPLGPTAFVAAFVAAVLIVLSAIDIERGIIPNRIVLPAAGIVLVVRIAFFPDRALEWVLAAILAGLVLLIPRLVRSDWMGMGDVKVALLLGAALGWGVLSALALGFICVFPAALLMIARDGVTARKATVPFAPFMALGALIVLFGPHLAGLTTS
jgi:leader peptidase (prepilin peptidase)/N-methyltransferase